MGAAPLSDDRPLVDDGEPVGSHRPQWRACSGAACAGCWSATAAATAVSAARRASATSCTRPRCSPRTPASTGRELARVRGRPVRRDRAGGPVAGRRGAAARRGDGRQAAAAGWPPTRAGCVAIEQDFAVRLDDGRAADRAQRPGRPAGGRRRTAGWSWSTSRPAGRRRRAPTSWPSIRSSAAYQVGGRGGRVRREATVSGGAALVQLGATSKARERAGAAAAGDDGGPGWARAMVRRTAETRWPPSTFRAVANDAAASARCARPARSPARAGRWSSRRAEHRRGRGDVPGRRRPAVHPVELARLLRLPTPTAEQVGVIAAPVGAAARGRRRRLRQDRDDGGPGGLAGRQRLRRARSRSSASRSPARRPASWRTASGSGSASSSAGCGRRRPASTASRRSPRTTRSPARIVREHGAAGRVRAVRPAAHRGRLLAARRRGRAPVRRRHVATWTLGRDRHRRGAAPRRRARRAPARPGRAWPPGPAGSSPRCTAARPAGCYADVADVLAGQQARLQLLPLVRAYAERKRDAGGDGLRRPAAPGRAGRPRPPRGRRDRAGPVPGRAARRVPGHQPRPGGAAAVAVRRRAPGDRGRRPVPVHLRLARRVRRHPRPLPGRVPRPDGRAGPGADADHQLAQPAGDPRRGQRAVRAAAGARRPGRRARPGAPPATARGRRRDRPLCAAAETYADEAAWIADRIARRLAAAAAGCRTPTAGASRSTPRPTTAVLVRARSQIPADRGGAARARACRSRSSAWAACWTPRRSATWSARCGCSPTRPTGRRCCGCSPARAGGSARVTWWRSTGRARALAAARASRPDRATSRIAPTGSTRRRWPRRWTTSATPDGVLAGRATRRFRRARRGAGGAAAPARPAAARPGRRHRAHHRARRRGAPRRGAGDAGLARGHLDAFGDVAARFAAESEGADARRVPGLPGRGRGRGARPAPGEVEVVEGAVQILTAHAAKGLEWDVVAVAGLSRGVWPGRVRTTDQLPLRPRGEQLAMVVFCLLGSTCCV